jgi:hypothetical protein
MTRLILMTLLVLSSGPAYAEWVLVNGNDETGMTVYVDPDTIHHKEDLVKMWHLFDFETIQTIAGDSFLSSKSQHEYDCAEELDRLVAFTRFSGNMGSGMVVLATQTNKSGNRFNQRVLVKLCGHLRAARSDRAAHLLRFLHPPAGPAADQRKVFYFTPTIRVPLRATQAEAKRANAKK